MKSYLCSNSQVVPDQQQNSRQQVTTNRPATAQKTERDPSADVDTETISDGPTPVHLRHNPLHQLAYDTLSETSNSAAPLLPAVIPVNNVLASKSPPIVGDNKPGFSLDKGGCHEMRELLTAAGRQMTEI
jgi:hypothetical protein